MKKETKKLSNEDLLSGSSLDLLSGTTPKASELKKNTIKTINNVGSAKGKSDSSKKPTTKDVKNKVENKKEVKPENKTKDKVEKKPSKSVVERKAETKVLKQGKNNKTNIADESELEDLEKINEEGLKNSATRGKRNQFVIIILSVLLVVALAFVVITMVMTKADTNCKLNLYGGVRAEYVVDGNEKSELRLRVDITSNSILLVDLNVKIKSSGEYKLKYKISCYFKGKLMKDYKAYEPNWDIFILEDGYYVTAQPVSGTVSLCEGVVINNEYGEEFNGYEFSMVVDTYIERA
mgnify:CR=1 FL=1